MVEEAKYQIIKKLDKVEVRLYPDLIIAEVDGYGDAGFNILFNYISGDNKTRTNLEMTAPVISKNIEMTVPVLSKRDSIAFIIAKDYNLENTPRPNDERIKIQEISKRYVAALRFGGRWITSNFRKKSIQLLEELEKSKIKTKGVFFTMRYSGPFTPWFLRRNEVAIEIEFKS
jgi:hypothetical protein